jgi:toxin-antitoxin system PIN domain toxin
VIVPDLNLLLYAVDASFPQHAAAHRWWQDRLNGDEPVGLCEVVSFGFLRLTTCRGVFAQPLAVDTALGMVEAWLQLPHVHALALCERSRALSWRWMRELGVAGNLSTDLQIAALALRERGTVYSNDTDFLRIPGLSLRNPLIE